MVGVAIETGSKNGVSACRCRWTNLDGQRRDKITGVGWVSAVGRAQVVGISARDDRLRIDNARGIRIGKHTAGQVPIGDCEVAVINRRRFKPIRKARYVWNRIASRVLDSQCDVKGERTSRSISSAGCTLVYGIAVVEAEDGVSFHEYCHHKKAADCGDEFSFHVDVYCIVKLALYLIWI